MEAIKEHARVVLRRSLPKDRLEAGDVGTVVHVYKDGSAYEVEFTALDGGTAAVVTVESKGEPTGSRSRAGSQLMPILEVFAFVFPIIELFNAVVAPLRQPRTFQTVGWWLSLVAETWPYSRAIVSATGSPMRYWWVNQNQTYRAEVRGSFMWSPKQNANGARNQFYENMREVSPGDVVFSFCDTRIKAVGVVTGGAQTGPKPDFGNAGLNWSKEGWFVPVDYCALNNQIRPKDHAAILRPFLPAKYVAATSERAKRGVESVGAGSGFEPSRAERRSAA